jgi:hypothetical protein
MHLPRAKWLWSVPGPVPYRLQYRKKLWGIQNKVWRKKIFSPKSMTKLEDLTVHFNNIKMKKRKRKMTEVK